MSLKSKWNSFKYNYKWSDWVGYIDGWIPKLSLSVPILGYLILFNDTVSETLLFNILASEGESNFGLEGIDRLRLVYFGLIFLGISNFLYRIRRPYQFRHGTNLVDYSKTCLEHFTLSDYVQIHGTIKHEQHLTQGGKYYDSEWDGFVSHSQNDGEGTDEVKRNGDWEGAKLRYGGLLRGMLSENFFRYDCGRRFWLTICLTFSTIGYVFLLIPSGDIFVKVIVSMLGWS